MSHDELLRRKRSYYRKNKHKWRQRYSLRRDEILQKAKEWRENNPGYWARWEKKNAEKRKEWRERYNRRKARETR
jgi:hypothetical protein